jgi:TPR repeat protein
LALWTYQLKREDAEAASWFRKSAEHGNRRAMSNLAYMYQQGLGVDMDLKQALYWYGKAADLHENRAMVMLPIVKKATALRGEPPNSLTIPEVLLNEVIPVSCNGSASSALKIAEAQLATMVSHSDAHPEPLGGMSNRSAGGFAKENVEAELINEYAWAGCFKDASRLLVSFRNTPYYVRDNILAALVKSLVHIGQYDRALVLAYSGQSESAQEGMLREITVGAALAGNYALAIDYINSLVKSDQFLLNSFYYAMKALVDKGDYVGAVKIGMSEKIRSRLGVEGNLLLAEALYRTNDKAEAVRALRDAQSHLPEYAYGYMMPSDSLISHVSRTQALLEPENVDASMQSVTQKSNDFRIQVLQTAILASSDQTWRLHWLDEIDQLSISIVERQKDLRYDDSMFACRGAQSYAFLGMYQRAFDLLQARDCGFDFSRDEQISQDLADIFQVAAFKNDILNAVKLMPPELGKPETRYQHHIFPLVYGLVCAGHYDEALNYLRLVEGRLGQGFHPEIEDLLAVIGKKADKNFPVQDWIDEINVNSAKLDLNRWDALRILFAICARTQGYDVAESQAKKFTGQDLASAEIGIAEGLRGLQIEPTYNPYEF